MIVPSMSLEEVALQYRNDKEDLNRGFLRLAKSFGSIVKRTASKYREYISDDKESFAGSCTDGNLFLEKSSPLLRHRQDHRLRRDAGGHTDPGILSPCRKQGFPDKNQRRQTGLGPFVTPEKQQNTY